MRTYWGLGAVYMSLNYVDVVSTLSMGGVELNPLFAPLIYNHPVVAVACKILIVLFAMGVWRVTYPVWKKETTTVMVVVCCWFSLVCYNNLFLVWG